MELKCKKMVMIDVDCWDLEKFIKENADKVGILINDNYELIAEEIWNNDSTYPYFVAKDNINPEDIIDIATGNLNFKLGTILTKFANANLIEEGKYIIDVCW